jgi:C_GCAxxG_C_C family probable redox protein
MTKQEDSLACFGEGFNCAQSVLSVYSAQYGVDRASALRLTGAFGGGIAGSGETCGAVTGALMVIGLVYASTNGGDAAAKETTKKMGRDFLERFQSAHGSCKCRDLLNCDVGTPQGREHALAVNLFKTLCPAFVADAAQILDTMICASSSLPLPGDELPGVEKGSACKCERIKGIIRADTREGKY